MAVPAAAAARHRRSVTALPAGSGADHGSHQGSPMPPVSAAWLVAGVCAAAEDQAAPAPLPPLLPLVGRRALHAPAPGSLTVTLASLTRSLHPRPAFGAGLAGAPQRADAGCRGQPAQQRRAEPADGGHAARLRHHQRRRVLIRIVNRILCARCWLLAPDARWAACVPLHLIYLTSGSL